MRFPRCRRRRKARPGGADCGRFKERRGTRVRGVDEGADCLSTRRSSQGPQGRQCQGRTRPHPARCRAPWEPGPCTPSPTSTLHHSSAIQNSAGRPSRESSSSERVRTARGRGNPLRPRLQGLRRTGWAEVAVHAFPPRDDTRAGLRDREWRTGQDRALHASSCSRNAALLARGDRRARAQRGGKPIGEGPPADHARGTYQGELDVVMLYARPCTPELFGRDKRYGV